MRKSNEYKPLQEAADLLELVRSSVEGRLFTISGRLGAGSAQADELTQEMSQEAALLRGISHTLERVAGCVSRSDPKNVTGNAAGTKKGRPVSNPELDLGLTTEPKPASLSTASSSPAANSSAPSRSSLAGRIQRAPTSVQGAAASSVAVPRSKVGYVRELGTKDPDAPAHPKRGIAA